MWYSLLEQSASRNACALDQCYILHEIFSVKSTAHVAIAKTYSSMKVRDVNNKNQMKSFFRGNL